MVESARTGTNASHFGIQVASSEDVAAAWARFKQAGLPTMTENDTQCCYALQDKVWIEDPDGNAWEVFVVKGDAAGMGEGVPKTGCCAPSIEAQDTSGATASNEAGGGCC